MLIEQKKYNVVFNWMTSRVYKNGGNETDWQGSELLNVVFQVLTYDS